MVYTSHEANGSSYTSLNLFVCIHHSEFFFLFQTDAVPILGSFLRKNQRALKLSTLVLLDTLVQNYSNAISIELLSKVCCYCFLRMSFVKDVNIEAGNRYVV